MIRLMLVAERRQLVLARLHDEGKIVARELADELGISEASIRRDLRDLAAAGRCQRVYGGAVPVSRALVDYRSRAGVERESKRRIAARAINADVFLLGVTGVHPRHGLTTGDAEEAAMKRTLARQAADTYVLASSEKIGAVSPYKVLDLAETAAVLTDAQDEALDALRRTAPAVIECA